MLSQTLTPDERDHVDERKFIEGKFASRDLQGMLVSEDTAKMRKDSRAAMAAEDQKRAIELHNANVKDVLSGAFKNVSQGQKNVSASEKTAIDTALSIQEGPPNDEPGTAQRPRKKSA